MRKGLRKPPGMSETYNDSLALCFDAYCGTGVGQRHVVKVMDGKQNRTDSDSAHIETFTDPNLPKNQVPSSIEIDNLIDSITCKPIPHNAKAYSSTIYNQN